MNVDIRAVYEIVYSFEIIIFAFDKSVPTTLPYGPNKIAGTHRLEMIRRGGGKPTRTIIKIARENADGNHEEAISKKTIKIHDTFK